MLKEKQLKGYDINKRRRKKKAREIKEIHPKEEKLEKVRLTIKGQFESIGRKGKMEGRKQQNEGLD